MFLDWKNRPEDYYALDIEADSLDPTRVWIMCWKNVRTGEIGETRDYGEIREFFERTKGSFYIGHNLVKYDVPVLNRLVGTRVPLSRLVDTLVLSTLYSPSLSGGHSLETWGGRFKIEKVGAELDDFSQLSPLLIARCHRDVEITTELFKRLTQVLSNIGFSERSIDTQHKITEIIARQQKNGFYFDGPRALALYQTLVAKQDNLKELVHEVFPPSLEEVGRYRRAYRQDGSFGAGYLKHCEQFPRLEINEDGTYRAFDYVEFNLGSAQQRAEKLVELGWVPEEFTPKGSPQPFQKGELAPSLDRFLKDKDVPEVSLIAKWMMFSSISGMVNTWLDNWNEDTGCIHGTLFVADTLRFRHQKPNTANIPAVRTGEDGHPVLGEAGYFTYESRDLWTARPGRVLVGTDAAGLELRMLAHYLKNRDFTEQVINGDPHSYNQEKAGLPTRANAKTFLYGFLYGAGDSKIGKIVGGNSKRGKELRETFIKEVPGLKEVITSCTSEFNNGRISLVDGSHIICPVQHAALNYKLQGSGSRYVCQALIFMDKHIRRKGLDSVQVGFIHDEVQWDVNPKDVEEHKKIAEKSFIEAGEELNLTVPMAGTNSVGKTWAESH